MQDIKLNNCEKQQRWKRERIQIKLFKISIKGVALGQIQHVGALFFSQLTYVLISYTSAKSVVNGDITLGMMVSIGYIIGQLAAPIGQIIDLAHSFQDAKISLERLNEIHNKEDEEQTILDKVIELPEGKDINVSNLLFSYSGSERDFVLKDISFMIPHNKVTAIVGESGKSEIWFSVIMPTYNNSPYIRRAIYSLINQAYLQWELIILMTAVQMTQKSI